MKIENPFSPDARLYPLRWFCLIVLALMVFLVYADQTGWRLFSGGSQQQWSARGPGYHK